MRSSYLIWRLLWHRGRADRWLTASFALGMLVTGTLLAAAPLYARAMVDLGLTFTIRDRLRSLPATRVELRDVPLASEEGPAPRESVVQRAEERIGWFSTEPQRLLTGPRLQLGTDARPRLIVTLWSLTAPEASVQVIEGRPPDGNGDGVLELALSPAAASRASLHVGDRLSLHDAFDDCERERVSDGVPPPPCAPRTTVRLPGLMAALVTGIVEPADPDAAVWSAGGSALPAGVGRCCACSIASATALAVTRGP